LQKNIYFHFIVYTKAFDYVDDNKLWKILKEMGIPDHLTYLLRNLYAGQAATVRMGHETMDWFQSGKEYVKALYCHPAYLIYMESEYLLYNVLLVSAVQQSESAIHIHVSPLFLDFLPTIEGQVPSTHHRPLSRVPCIIQ